MTIRYFKVVHKAGAFIDGVHYPCADDQEEISQSIVELNLGPKDAAPLWGVEVDAHGNEIGERATTARETLGNKLADKIADDAGQGANKAQGTKQEAEQRKQTVIQTLELLDHTKDEDWTKDGLPQVEVVANASGLEGLTRKEISEAAPDFVRKKPE